MQSPLLKIVDVTKNYGDYQALKGVSLDLYPGEIVSLLGVNGAGKTTLSSIIGTLRPLTSGDIIFNGASIYSDIVAYRRQIGFCQQKPNLNNYLTLRENLQFAGRYFDMTDEQIDGAIMQLARQFNFEKYLDKNPMVLSGGYKQRFMLARSVIHKPKLIILDEPTAALDAESERLVIEALERLMKGRTVLTIAHRLSTIRNADKIIVLKNGVVAEQGSHDQLLALGGTYAELYSVQFDKTPAKAAL